MTNEDFHQRLIRAMIKTDSLEKELTGLKNQIADTVLDKRVRSSRLNLGSLRRCFEGYLNPKLVLEIGEYLDKGDEAIDDVIDKFIAIN